MNPVQQKIKSIISEIPDTFASVRQLCEDHLQTCSAIDLEGNLLINHQPWTGYLGYQFAVYPGAKKSWFAKYQKQFGLKIPPPVREMLMAFNGCELFGNCGITIFGIPQSILGSQMLDRSSRQCRDIGAANRAWIGKFSVEPNMFYFGVGAFTYEEQVGYFLNQKKKIEVISKSTSKVVSLHDTFEDFFSKQITRVSQIDFDDTSEDYLA